MWMTFLNTIKSKTQNIISLINMEYSIYIRTLGKGGEKYALLLNSIKHQTISPKEVVVVLPYGYDEPNEKLGTERFAYCEKGMLKQRIFAINDAKTAYILLLDDDVEFAPDFVEKEFRAMVRADAECCIAKMFNNASINKSKIKKYINHFIGSEVYKKTHDNFLFKINNCGGFVVNTAIDKTKPVYSQTGHGSNCLCSVEALKKIHFEDELWLERSGYALPDDQVMFYKLYLSGTKIAVCMDTYFRHLDAASTNDGTRYLRIAQSKAGNFLIFWYRFIFLKKGKIARYFTIFPAMNRILMECILYILKCHNLAVVKAIVKGWKYGISYILKYKNNEH